MGGMSDNMHQGKRVGLLCRLKNESVAKYHADEQDMHRPRKRQLNFELGKQEEKRGTWAIDRLRAARKDTTEGASPRAQIHLKSRRRAHLVVGSSRKEERDVGRR
jgi:hypothetical protein